jgi:hypothetical protein
MGDRAGRHLERGGPGSPTQGEGSFSNYLLKSLNSRCLADSDARLPK